ncbi:MAG TPA: glycosyltransferase [Thermomicrobiaceae bacterium]|nr:glycosyltransferase [Thermomicrobiaceae bacterium]
MSDLPRVSVVVPTCRRPELLDRCLAALAAQDLDPAGYEVVVADDGHCPATRGVVACWAARAPAVVRYVPVTCGRGPAAARNAGWRAARGVVVAFTDDDCQPTPDWLARGLAGFVDGVQGVSGRVLVPLGTSPTDYEWNAAGLERSTFVTASCFYRRSALAAAGGLDERFEQAWREDTDLYFTLLERGARLEVAPDAVVVHPVRPAAWGISLRQQRKSMYNALLYKKHPALYRERVQSEPPWGYYATVAALVAASALGVTGRRRPALAGALAWLVLTTRFCARRLDGTSRAPAHVAEMAVTSALIPPLAVFWRLRGALRFRVRLL